MLERHNEKKYPITELLGRVTRTELTHSFTKNLIKYYQMIEHYQKKYERDDSITGECIFL